MTDKKLIRTLQNMYGDLSLPVVVCENRGDMPVVYMNARAALMFSPSASVDRLAGEATSMGRLDALLHFDPSEAYQDFVRLCSEMGRVSDYHSHLTTFDGKHLPVLLTGKRIDGRGVGDCFVFYLMDIHGDTGDSPQYEEGRLSFIINAALLDNDADASIKTVLAMAGRRMQVSRVYIFEELSATTTANTYEWCAEGIDPAIDTLQELKKEDYNYDVIVASGMYIVETVRTLPDGDRAILEAQGIHSLAIIPIYGTDRPLGYVGFDDCVGERKWSYESIQFLQNVALLLASLIKRRNAEQMVLRSQKVLQLISDNSEDIIYVNSLDDYRLLFVSRSTAEVLGATSEDLVGHPCYKIFSIGGDGPCDYCPIPHVKLEPGSDRSEVYTWEHTNPLTGKTYLCKGTIIKWVDGQFVHVETAVDISKRITYEEQLRFLASTDVMTGVYKREWGSNALETMLRDPANTGSLIFIDIDGLKKVNDTLGHALGDELLKKTVAFIREQLPEDSLLCRWGGDEFLAWVKQPAEGAGEIISRAQAAMGHYNQVGGRPFQIAFSFGIIPFVPGPDASLDALVTAADQFMYKNKMAKRGLRRRRDDG